jgi:4'-phosphopantetheinyl transferase
MNIHWKTVTQMPELTKDTCHTWCINFSQFTEKVESFYADCPLQVREKADSYLIQDARESCIICHALLRRLIGAYLNFPHREIVLETNNYGKPALVNTSLPLHFNLSHSGQFGLLSFSLQSPTGVDIELKRPLVALNDAAKIFLSPYELSNLSSMNYDAAFDEFYTLWTMKESLIKCLGYGFSFDVKHFAFDQFMSGNSPIIKVFDKAYNWLKSYHVITIPSPAEHYSAALATKDSHQQYEFYNLNTGLLDTL